MKADSEMKPVDLSALIQIEGGTNSTTGLVGLVVELVHSQIPTKSGKDLAICGGPNGTL